ncbi:MAG TPA: DUF485 domain-containing protein [Dermatophilaceae bacterium]|nr:DUF485 domain-containing protein [Dermatophilaceae bacterium]
MPSVNPHAAELQEYYEAMAAAKKRLVGPLVALTLVYFFVPVAITYFTTLLDGEVVPGLSWAFLYVFTTFFFVVAVTTYYRSQINKVEASLGATAGGETK